jgi:uncharacterized membrane protein YiaA
MKASKAMVFQVLKWIAFVAAAWIWQLGMSSTEGYQDETGWFTSAIFLIIVAIFFHLEQHKSSK